ncbi:MAG TPA: serine/threonine-protein kinase, partial [Anaerolineales bacterium]|nr:serine/threonine-protein kinase [Anaerolineales bacterium]
MTTPSHPPISTIAPGSSFRQYTLLEQIGVGGQGVVWSALDQGQNRICAIKFNEIPESAEGQADDIRTEHQLEQLVKFHHPHIVPFNEFGFEGRVRFSVSPYIAGGTLSQKIKAEPQSIEKTLHCGMEIASALDFLHSQGVIHRDLKSSNILLDLANRSYLADFGLARVISTSTLAFHTGHGTPPYAPPEQNRLTAITPRSDVYSFGILLYEMFTGQLPWNGKKQLGMEQLHSNEELPDPRVINIDLPPRLVDVLRRVTSADPERRPRSAGEVMKMIYYIFNIPYKGLDDEDKYDEQAARRNDVAELLGHGLSQWESTDGIYNVGLTRFALINLERENIGTDAFNSFLLSQALTYGYKDDHWWSAVSDPRARLWVSSILLRKGNDAIAERVVGHLVGDMEILAFSDKLPEDISESLLEIGAKTYNMVLRRQILDGIRELTQPGKRWSDKALSLSISQIEHLGELALEDSDAGDAAAALIGHLRAIPAVQVVLNHHDDRRIAALLLIQRVAESLPANVQGNIRFRVSLEWILQRLIQQPVSLIGAYMTAFLGAALGVGMQVYQTYNLPDFLDIARFTTSLEQGLIVGAVFGLGVFLIRVVAERFRTADILLRVVFGTIFGGLGMNIALLVFHV